MQEHITIPQAVRELVPPRSALSFKEDAVLPALLEHSAGPPVYVRPDLRHRNLDRVRYEFCKRSFDLTFSLLLLILLSPLMFAVAVLIKFSSPGPMIYRHRRLGRYGREFECWKFRTMVCNAEEILEQDPELLKRFDARFKIDDDPRITRFGALLRRTSVDELPQLFQVVKGTMSLVGPRPIIAREIGKYSIYGEKLLGVKPGLGGLWQTSGRSDTTYQERIALDMKYIDSRSLGLDLQLLMRTALTVVTRSGAC